MSWRRRCQGQWWHNRVRGCGYRMTIGRQAIIEALSSAQEHLSAEDIYAKIHDQYPQVGLTTVYRTLDMLVQAGLVFKFDFGDGRARYELTKGSEGAHHHHHLVCTQCKRVIDYTDFMQEELDLLKRIQKVLSHQYQFDIQKHMIHFYGTCQECRNE